MSTTLTQTDNFRSNNKKRWNCTIFWSSNTIYSNSNG